MARTALPIRYGYADTRHGQLHHRRCVDGRVDLALLHWAPGSGRMFEAVLPALAESGVVGVAFDLPGFGMSFKPREAWGPADSAAALLEGLDHFGARPVAVLGGHLGANVAVEMALLDPRRVAALVLDGVYASTPEENAELLRPYAAVSPRFSPSGEHERFAWRMTEIILREWNPRFVPDQARLPEIYATMCDYLHMGYDAMRAWLEPGDPPAHYDVLERLAQVQARVLVLAAQEEALRPCFDRALQARPGAQGHEFPGNHPLFDCRRAGEYASVLAEFLRP